ncbi:mast cell-expressed membrane protein 1 [Hippopotamus amphibius kiboko]|uniref:mast cell-expressed membrane protein 1 n=1 Tax=Hippopotamus amphibius kiboko TaxID=575201 RepID=UPI0025977E75|nr:mast cell-expressed membrane protein 1 [Hippopotamus amphibius kiboko]
MNQEVEMQAAAFKDKKWGSQAHKKGADDPAYENITFKSRDQPEGSHSPPKSKAQSKPSSDPAQVPHWLPRAMMSLQVLLALSCIVLLAMVLVKNSEMSQELLVLKEELQNVSISVGQCQEKQEKHWNSVNSGIQEAKHSIDTVKNKVQEGNQKLKTLETVSNEIKSTSQKILQELKMPKPRGPHGHARPRAATFGNP